MSDHDGRRVNANGWVLPSARRGNFAYRTVASAIEHRVADAYVDRTYFGLPLLGAYLWSSFGDDEGNTLAPMRKCTAEMSSGLQLQTNVGREQLEVDADAYLRSQRGIGVRWSRDGDESLTIAAAASPNGEPVHIRVTDTELAWHEGPDGDGALCDLGGRLLGAYQWYTPTRDENGGNYYSSVIFRAEGTVLGRPVQGIVGYDLLYGPQGQVFGTGPMFNAIELAWVSFANCYDDGSYEAGCACLGSEHWGFSVIIDEAGERLAVTDLEADLELTDTLYISAATFHLPGGDWRFTAGERTEMRSLAAARGDKYHGQGGTFRRVGDARTPVLSRAWIESFPANGTDRAGVF